MGTVRAVVCTYLWLMTLCGFFSMIVDKKRAIDGGRRISEGTLFLLALLGGSLGSFLGMQTVRHKTRHWYFVLFIPLILAVQLALLLLFFNALPAN